MSVTARTDITVIDRSFTAKIAVAVLNTCVESCRATHTAPAIIEHRRTAKIAIAVLCARVKLRRATYTAPQLSSTAEPPKSPLQSCARVGPVAPPTQRPQLSSTAEPPKSPLQSCVHASSPVAPPTQRPQPSSTAEPPKSPLQFVCTRQPRRATHTAPAAIDTMNHQNRHCSLVRTSSPVAPPTQRPQSSSTASPPKSPLQSCAHASSPVAPPTQRPQSSRTASPPISPLHRRPPLKSYRLHLRL